MTCVLLLISVHTYGHNYPHINLSNGFLPSTSTEICDEIALVFPRVIAEGPIPLEKQGQDHAKIVDVERIKPITQVIIAITTDKEPSLLNRFFIYKKNLFKLKGEEMGIK